MVLKTTRENLLSKIIRESLKFIYLNTYKSANIKTNTLNIISKYKWKNLIILDACRYDILQWINEKINIFPNSKVRPIISNSSSTPEFIRNVILNNKEIFSKVVYISANPMIDVSLNHLGIKPKNLFFKYVAVWKKCWNEFYNTVLPEDVFYITLKYYIKYSPYRFVIHFMQPHFPYISEKYIHINKLVYEDIKHIFLMGHDEENNVYMNEDINNIKLLLSFIKLLIKCGAISSILSTEFCKYVKKHSIEILRAYIINLLKVLPYTRKLSDILYGKTIIISDHGEALGEFIHPYIPIRLWGHISKLRIPPLTVVPFIEIDNNIPIKISLRKALRSYVNVMSKNSF